MITMNKVLTTHKSGIFKKDFNPDDYVTVFADASFDHRSGAAGFAGWVKYGAKGDVIKVHGGFKATSSEEAELYGLDSTLNKLILDNVPVDGKRIIIQCDCLGALSKLDVTCLLELGAAHIKLKHVKGHNGSGDPRSAVNTWCDKIAYKRMVEIRDNLTGVQNV